MNSNPAPAGADFTAGTQAICPRCGGAMEHTVFGRVCLNCLVKLSFDEESKDAAGPGVRCFGEYELRAEVGRGGMGVVYRAWEPKLERLVALKMLHAGLFSSTEFLKRFQQEARAAAQLKHPGIVTIYESGTAEGHLYYAMELVEGRTLSDYLRESGPRPPREAARFVRLVAEATAHAHAHGVLHLDLKPQNILLDPSSAPRVVDFGLTHLAATKETDMLDAKTFGSPSYVAPEQAGGDRGPVSVATDVYGLGAVLYEMLTGRPPHQGASSQEVLVQVREAPVVSPRLLIPSVPRDLETVCLKCLEKVPARRYGSARDLAEDLLRFETGEPVRARRLGAVGRAIRWSKRNPALACVALMLLFVSVASGAIIFNEWMEARSLAMSESAARAVAQASEHEMRLNLYAADLLEASRHIEAGDFVAGRTLLERHRPRRGHPDLRGFEWRLLWNRSQTHEIAAIKAHDGIVMAMAASGDGRWLATGGHLDHTVKIWRTNDHGLEASIVPDGFPCRLAFSTDSQSLVVGSVEGSIERFSVGDWKKWDSIPGENFSLSRDGKRLVSIHASPLFWKPPGKVVVWNLDTRTVLPPPPGMWRSAALSADGARLALADGREHVRLWDIARAEFTQKLDTGGVGVRGLVFGHSASADILMGFGGEGVVVWDLASGVKPKAMLHDHPLTVWSAAFNADGSQFATCSSDRSVRWYDARTLAARGVLRGQSDEVWSLAFSSDGARITAGGKDGRVLVWDLALAAAPPPVFPHHEWLRPVFSRDGNRILTFAPRTQLGDCAVLSDLNSGALLKVFPSPFPLCFSTDGSLQKIHIDPPAIESLDPGHDDAVKKVPVDLPNSAWHGVKILVTSPNGSSLFVAATKTWWLIDTASGHVLWQRPADARGIRSAVFSSDGRRLAVLVLDVGEIQIFDDASNSPRVIQAHALDVNGACFSPDGLTLATGGSDAFIRLWNVRDGQKRSEWRAHTEEVTDVAFAPDGRTLASLHVGSQVRFWHLATLREIANISLPNAGSQLVFAPDGRRLAVVLGPENSGGVRVFDAPDE